MGTNYNKMFTSNEDSTYVEGEGLKEPTLDPLDTNPRIAKVANCKLLNVRRTPSLTGEVLRIINKGEEVLVEEDLNADWCRIEVDKSKGYVMRKYITT